MKMNLSAVVLSAVAFFAPVAAYADEVTDLKPGESATGFINPAYGFDQRTELWNTKELVIRHNGVLKRLNVTKYICVPTCYYKIEYVGNIEPKQQINYYDMNQLLRPNSGGQNVPDSEVEKKAKEMGVEKERLKKALADKNEMARLIREIEVKRAEQKKKEKDDKEKQGKGGGGGSSGGGGGGSSGGGGGSSGGNGSGSNGNGSGSPLPSSPNEGPTDYSMSFSVYMREHGYGSSRVYVGSGYADGRCSTISSIGSKGLSQITGGSYKDLSKTGGYYEFFCSYLNPSDSKKTNSELNNRASKESRCSENSVKQLSNSKGKFSVVCTEKAKDTNFGGASVGSLGGNSSTSSNSSNSSSSSGSGAGGGGSVGGGASSNKGNGAGATAGGNGANDGGRAPSAGGGTAQNSYDSSPNKTDSSNLGQGNSKMGGSDDMGNKSGASSGESNGSKKADSDGNSGGNSDGNGDGSGSEQYGLPDVPDVPDGGGEPDWNGIKSDGNFGMFSPSSTFATGGQCPQDILLDFGQFGRHSFSWSPICEAAQRLRYVFITLAYFMAAMMVYKTVNSMRG